MIKLITVLYTYLCVVFSYVSWNLHEDKPGNFNFDDILDIRYVKGKEYETGHVKHYAIYKQLIYPDRHTPVLLTCFIMYVSYALTHAQATM